MADTRGVSLVQMEDSFGWVRRVALCSPVPVVVRLHGPWFLTGQADGAVPDRSFRRRVSCERAGVLAAHGVCAPSRAVLDAVRAHVGMPLADAEVIPNPIEPVAESERWRLGKCDRDQVLFVGRFDKVKGGDVMIRAFGQIAAKKPNARLLFVGEDRGVRSGNGDMQCLNDCIRDTLPSAARARVHAIGFQPPDVLARLRRQSLITVVSSRFETFGNTAVEAMVMGCPVVASMVGGLSEIVQDDRNGLLCRPGDAEDLAAKMLTLLKSPELGVRLGRQAAIDAEDRYHPRIIAEKTLAFYERVIERFKANRTARRRWRGRQ